LVWLIISDVLVHGPLTTLLWSYGSITHHCGSMWHLKQPESKRERKDQGPIIPFKGIPLMTSVPSTRSQLLKVPPSSNSAMTVDQAFNTWTCEGYPRSKLWANLFLILWFIKEIAYSSPFWRCLCLVLG
jgi:hypothetical protein